MSLCIIPLLTSSLSLPTDFVLMFLGWTPTKCLLKLGCYPYFSWNYGCFSAIFGHFLKNLLL